MEEKGKTAWSVQTEQARREKGQHMNASSVKKDAVQHVLRNISKDKML